MAKLTSLVTAATLLAIGGVSTVAARQHVDMIDDNLPGLMEQFAINTPLRIEHFLAQVAHESDSFAALEEYASVAPMKVVGIWEMSALATASALRVAA